jgi:hypothetical protein
VQALHRGCAKRGTCDHSHCYSKIVFHVSLPIDEVEKYAQSSKSLFTPLR